ncbi:prepilin peptidase [Nocardioides sp. NPDC057764]|uniref:prepilin peptidase n=1 Tax=Nocardioides sp. NPDC057764 TaxID=3346243 RepID=UPI00366A6CFB
METNTALVALVSAAVAGILVLAAPRVVRALPAPLDSATPPPDAADVVAPAPAAAGDVPPAPAYEQIAAAPWLIPAGLVTSALAAGLLGLAFGPDRVLLALIPLVPLGYLLAVIDARTHFLPRLLVTPATLAVAAALLLELVLTGDLDTFIRAAAGFAIAGLAFWLLWFFFPGGMGYGDVRLAGLVGLVTARLGWDSFIICIYGALLLAALYALGRRVLRRSQPRAAAMPMGPFFIVAAWAGLLAGGL